MTFKKFIKIIGIAICIYLFLALGAHLMSPGSYANSELYIINRSYENTESAIARLKDEYPQYRSYFYPIYKNDSTLVEIISKAIYTDNDTILEDEYIYSYPKDYFLNSKGDTIKYEGRDSILVEDSNDTFKFYLRDIGYSVNCRLYKQEDSYKTKIALVSAYNEKSKDLKSINTNELSKEENKRIKKEFETKILNKLGEWEKDGIFPFYLLDD